MDSRIRLAEITFKNYKTEAYLSLFPAEAATQESLFEAVTQELEAKAVKRGFVLFDAVQQAISKLLENKEPQTGVLIAKGQMPVHGKDSKLDFKIDLFTQQVGKQLEDGSIDYREINKYKVVYKDGEIVSRTPPAPGTPGQSVCGDALECKNGREIRMNTGKNIRTQTDEAGVDHFFATVSGAVSYSAERKFLDVLTEIKIEGDIDYNVGNLVFPGNVYITGFVQGGFVVKATGKVYVGKSISNALVESDMDVNVKEGIIGGSTVRAKGQVQALFVENSQVEAAGDILIRESVVDSHIGSQSCVTAGSIVTGSIRAIFRILLQSAGNSLHPKSELLLGISKELKDRKAAILEEIARCDDNFNKIDQCLRLTGYGKGKEVAPDRQAQVQALIAGRDKLQLQSMDLRDEADKIDQLKQKSLKGYVSVAGTIYPGVVVAIHNEKHSPPVPKEKISFRLNAVTFSIEEIAYKE